MNHMIQVMSAGEAIPAIYMFCTLILTCSLMDSDI